MVSGLASAALVILLALDATVLFRSGMLASAPAAAPLAASEALSAEKAAAGEMSDEIIFWSTPTIEAFGKGGGAPDPSSDANSDVMAMPAEPQAELPPSAESPVAESQVSNAPPVGLPVEATPEVPLTAVQSWASPVGRNRVGFWIQDLKFLHPRRFSTKFSALQPRYFSFFLPSGLP